jgi:hypothetical protein
MHHGASLRSGRSHPGRSHPGIATRVGVPSRYLLASRAQINPRKGTDKNRDAQKTCAHNLPKCRIFARRALRTLLRAAPTTSPRARRPAPPRSDSHPRARRPTSRRSDLLAAPSAPRSAPLRPPRRTLAGPLRAAPTSSPRAPRPAPTRRCSCPRARRPTPTRSVLLAAHFAPYFQNCPTGIFALFEIHCKFAVNFE